MSQLVALEVNKHIAAQESIVKNQIDIEVVVIEGEPFLTSLKEKPFAQFKQEVFEVVDNGRFKCMFRISVLLFQIQKLKHEGAFDHMVSRVT